MPTGQIHVGLAHRVFRGEQADDELSATLRAAREAGAELAVLPELPLDAWAPAARIASDEDAEPPGGPRARRLAEAARTVGIAVLGGAIVRDPDSGRRFNRGLLFDAAGDEVAAYDKLHLPSEEGFWESDHYEPGLQAPRRIDALGFPIGIQICSDLNRLQGCLLLAAQGAAAIFAPRATPASSYPRWKTVIRAIAIATGSYVISVNRTPNGEAIAPGGPSLAVDPDGEILAESESTVTVVTLEAERVRRARRDYPGYLAYRGELYSAAWAGIGPGHTAES